MILPEPSCFIIRHIWKQGLVNIENPSVHSLPLPNLHRSSKRQRERRRGTRVSKIPPCVDVLPYKLNAGSRNRIPRSCIVDFDWVLPALAIRVTFRPHDVLFWVHSDDLIISGGDGGGDDREREGKGRELKWEKPWLES